MFSLCFVLESLSIYKSELVEVCMSAFTEHKFCCSLQETDTFPPAIRTLTFKVVPSVSLLNLDELNFVPTFGEVCARPVIPS